jgi:predicted ATPase/class 3 adenylate cyclase
MIPTSADSITFLFTDIQGSTRLWEQHPEAMKAALARHDAILRQAIESHGGHVFKTVGDGFCAAFTSAPEALSAALDAQRALHAEAQNVAAGGPVIRVRMGLHSGAVEARDNDYFGPPLNRVTRLMSAGHGGQTLLSAATDELVRGHLPPGVELRDLGERRLKDLTRPEHIYQLLAPDLPAEFPPLRALDAFRTNLPAQLTSFVGREKEIGAVKQLITANRLTTLTGPGGTGKTRLSLQVAADLLDSFSDGVWFVELAPLADPALVTQTVIAALGLRQEASYSQQKILTDYLGSKTALLILDNCEHLVDASAQLAETLLLACPTLRMLASSREALGIPGEVPYRVPSLSLPHTQGLSSLELVSQSEAARLFVDRAKTVLPGFAVSAENAPAIIQICARLDGIPLAIELAAARVKILNVEQIAERLDDRFRLLTGGSRTALPRQQTLRALIDWSYDLLSITERSLLVRLSIFAGGWSLEAAEQICKDEENKGSLHNSDFILHPFDVLDLLTQLVNKSLVIADSDNTSEPRSRLLETVRQYAREKLLETGLASVVRNRYLEHFMQLAERAESEFNGPDQVLWMSRMELELDNLRAAMEWSLDQNFEAGMRLVSALKWFWVTYAHFGDGIEKLTQLLARPQASISLPVRAKALEAQSLLLPYVTNYELARTLGREALVLYQTLGDRCGMAACLLALASCTPDLATARSMIEEALTHYQEMGDKPGMARALGMLGIFTNAPDSPEIRDYLERSLSICRELGHIAGIGSNLINLGTLAIREGNYELARSYLEEALEVNRAFGRARTAETLMVVSELAFWEGRYQQAHDYLMEVLSVMRDYGQAFLNNWTLTRLAYIALRVNDPVHARQLFELCLKDFTNEENTIGIIYVLEGFASVAVAQNQPAYAAQLFAWADVMREKISNTRPPTEQADVDRDLVTIHAQLDDEAFAEAQAAGRAMRVDEAIAFSLLQTVDR